MGQISSRVLKWGHVHLHCIVIPIKVAAAAAGSRSPAASFAPPAEAVAQALTNDAGASTDGVSITSLREEKVVEGRRGGEGGMEGKEEVKVDGNQIVVTVMSPVQYHIHVPCTCTSYIVLYMYIFYCTYSYTCACSIHIHCIRIAISTT